MTKEKLEAIEASIKGKEVEIQEDVWIKANHITIGKTESFECDGVLIPGHEYVSFSEEGSGWYEYYEKYKIRDIKTKA